MDFHFSCTGCGKCCNSGPSLALSEVPHYIHDFPLQLIFNAATKYENGAEDSSLSQQFAHVEKMGGKIVYSGSTRSIIRLSAGVIEPNSQRKCMKLKDDGLCSIYERRPAMCRVVPFGPMLPERIQPKVFEQAFNPSKSDWNCDFSSQAPLLWSEGEIKDAGYKKDFEKAVEINNDGALQSRILQHVDSEYLTYVVKSQSPGFSLTLHLQALVVECPELFGDEVKNVADIQLGLIRECISVNVARKNKEDRKFTEDLRKAEAGWANFKNRPS